MQQTIGISFQATGGGEVVRTVRSMTKSLWDMVAAAQGVNRALNTVGLNMSRTMTATASSVKAASADVTAAAASMSRAQKGSTAATTGAVGAAQAHGKGSKGGKGDDSTLAANVGGAAWFRTFGTAARFAGAYAAFAGAKEMVGIAAGSHRKDLLQTTKDLAAVGIDSKQQRQVDIAASAFLQRNPHTGDLKGYRDALAQVAGTYDTENDPRFGKGADKLGVLNRMTQDAMQFAATAKMSTDEASKLIAAQVSQQYNSLSDSEKGLYLTRKKNIEDLFSVTAGQLAKITEVSPAWGKDVQEFAKHGANTMYARGFKSEDIYSLPALMKDAGLVPSTAGRSMKTLLEDSQMHGKAAILGDPSVDPRFKEIYNQLPVKQQEIEERLVGGRLLRQMKDDPIKGLADFGRNLTRIEKAGGDISRFVSKDFIPQARMVMAPDFEEKWKELSSKVKEGDIGASGAKIREAYANEPGARYAQIGQSWDLMAKAMGASSGTGMMSRNISQLIDTIDTVTNAFNGTVESSAAVKSVGVAFVRFNYDLLRFSSKVVAEFTDIPELEIGSLESSVKRYKDYVESMQGTFDIVNRVATWFGEESGTTKMDQILQQSKQNDENIRFKRRLEERKLAATGRYGVANQGARPPRMAAQPEAPVEPYTDPGKTQSSSAPAASQPNITVSPTIENRVTVGQRVIEDIIAETFVKAQGTSGAGWGDGLMGY